LKYYLFSNDFCLQWLRGEIYNIAKDVSNRYVNLPISYKNAQLHFVVGAGTRFFLIPTTMRPADDSDNITRCNVGFYNGTGTVTSASMWIHSYGY